MPQFLIGFWCGCVSAALVLGLLFSNRKKQQKSTKEEIEDVIEESGSNSGTGPKVLLIDDSRLSRKVMKGYLAKRNPRVYEAGSGTDGLKAAKNNTFDVIFIDQCMPGMDGDETLHCLRKDGSVGPDVPIIAVGSTVRKEQEAEFRLKGYVTCLGKPIQENRLDEIWESLFSQSEALQEDKDPGGAGNQESPTTELPKDRKQREPEGFFYEKGLENFGGDDDAYRETLVLFADLWVERKEQLRQFLEENNMPEYAILIHAIKGDARTLGAEGLGELAYEQELRAKAGDTEAISSTFDRVIGEGDTTAEYFKQMYS